MSKRLLLFIINLGSLFIVWASGWAGYNGGFLLGRRIATEINLFAPAAVPAVIIGVCYILIGTGGIAYIILKKSLAHSFSRLASIISFQHVIQHYITLALFSLFFSVGSEGLLVLVLFFLAGY